MPPRVTFFQMGVRVTFFQMGVRVLTRSRSNAKMF